MLAKYPMIHSAMQKLTIIDQKTRAEGADNKTDEEKLFITASNSHEIAKLMEAYYNQKNKGRIGARLIKATSDLLDKLRSAHTGDHDNAEKKDIAELQNRLTRLKEQDDKLRREAEYIATQTAKLTWKITRNTRPDKDVRHELAGISKRIEELLV